MKELVQTSCVQPEIVGHNSEATRSACDAYLRGVADADMMVGALWEDLFDKDQVKASGSYFFDKWRERIRSLAPEGGVKTRRDPVACPDRALIERCKSEGFDASAAKNLLSLIGRAGLKLEFKDPLP